MRYFVLCLMSLAASALFTQLAPAEGCRVVGVRTTSHATTTTYAAPYYPVQTQVVQVPTFFQVAPEIVSQRLTQANAEEQQKRLEEAADRAFQKFLNTLRAEQQQQAPATTQPVNASTNDDPLLGVAVAGLDGGHSGATAGKPDIALLFRSLGCVLCHGSGERVDLSPGGLLRMSAADRDRVLRSVNHEEGYKAMPPAKPKVPLVSRRTIEQWSVSR